MDKLEWMQLAEYAECVRHAIEHGNMQMIADAAANLASYSMYKAEEAAEHGGWYEELEDFIDTMTFPC